jgi:hypothetical protein
MTVSISHTVAFEQYTAFFVKSANCSYEVIIPAVAGYVLFTWKRL